MSPFSKAILLMLLLFLVTGCMRSDYKIALDRDHGAESEKIHLQIGVPQEEVILLNLEEAVEIALCQNLELAVKARGIEFQEELLTRARFNMLPKLMLNGLRSYRNKNTGSFSESLEPGVPPAPPSISSEQKVRTYDITFVWNLLDFGISYYRARQEANRTVSKIFEYEREKQRITLEVVRLFWMLAAQQKYAAQAELLWEASESVRTRVKENVDKGILGIEQGARFNSFVLSIQIKIKDNLKDYQRTLSEFKALLGFPPHFEVQLTGVDEFPVNPEFPSLEDMEALALSNRPELFQKDLDINILADETRIGLLQLFPTLSPFTSQNYDGNRFLIYHHWWVAGINASWNLLSIPGNIAYMQSTQAQKVVVRSQSLVQAMAIVTQLHLAYRLFEEDFDRYRVADEFRKQTEILRYGAVKRQGMIAIGDLQVLQALAEGYAADLEAGKSYADLMGTLELVNNSMGLPFFISPYAPIPSMEDAEPCD